MADRGLESIEVEGYTSIRSATVSLGRLNVLIGANGAGKSNFIRVFELLGRLVESDLAYFVGLNGGASALLNSEPGTRRIRIQVDTPLNGYEVQLVPAGGDELIFENEFIHHEEPAPGGIVRIGRGSRETGLHDRAVLRFRPHVRSVVDLLRGCRVYHFHDTSRNAPVKQLVPTADNLSLRSDAGNLAAVLLALAESEDRADQAAYRRIIGVIRQVAPFFRDFVLRPEKGDRLRLRWRPNDSDAVFSADQMSDGTLRFACLATLLLHPRLPALVVLDEPELGLHPYAVVQLAGLLRQASARGQVLIATQSVTLMNQFDIDDLIVVERVDGASAFTRPDRERLTEWLQEYSLGELWEKNIIGGRPGGGA
ncbi:AAA family ATPase [Saccharothrix syringae]|uniref:Chromosome segregation protein SMC n=1 Tax=Saccharothrix syringae TaxID=103733 RepID=A0A5Q0GS34_SACSY|nr:AAA family ATPase [Saccharothrix syringae]QFZ16789.1 chromosome segregation protein SMC [Saccharothrix syringae]